MAAVIELHTGRALTAERPSSTRPQDARPRLRVIHGGRSDTARSMRRVFLVRRVAVLVGVVVAVWLMAQLLGAAFGSAGADAAPVVAPGAVHVVEPGDTLWSLASAVDPESDPRDVVDRIIQLNEGGAAVTPAGHLVAGTTLRLPVAS